MKLKFATSILLATALIAPLASYADTSTSTDTPTFKTEVKDSVITTKIKSELATHKFSSLFHVKVETDENGFVILSGTAKSQTEIDTANSVAKNVKGVTFVKNMISLTASAQ